MNSSIFEVPPLWSGGPKPGKHYNFPEITSTKKLASGSDTKNHTMYPITTGTSVVAFVYEGGILMAADSKGSYGSMARYMNIERLFKVSEKAVLACGGDIADFQFIREVIEQKVRDEDKQILDAPTLHCWLTRVLYNRRSKFDPLWLDCVVSGYKDDKPFLGMVNKIGMAYDATEVATGMGLHFALPLIREAREKKGKLSREDARNLMITCMKLLYYRDCKAHFNFHLSDITADGVKIEQINIKKDTNWDNEIYTRDELCGV